MKSGSDSSLVIKDPNTFNMLAGAIDNYRLSARQYSEALAATSNTDYKTKADIFESASTMYGTLGAADEQKTVEDAAAVARAHEIAEGLPLPAWIALLGVIGGIILIRRKKVSV